MAACVLRVVLAFCWSVRRIEICVKSKKSTRLELLVSTVGPWRRLYDPSLRTQPASRPPPSPSLLAKLFGALGLTDSEVCEGAFHNEWDIGI